MMHILFHIIFALGLLRWLSWELKKSFRPSKYWGWLIVNIFLGVLASALSQLSLSGQGIGNVLLHAIGGGMATAATYEYLRLHLGFKLNWRLNLGALFLLVSAFGVLNEIFEYFAELVGYGIYSIGPQDTWKDMVANSCGAIIMWIAILGLKKLNVIKS